MVGNMITALEAAEKIHCSKEYIHYLRKEGKIKGYRVGSRYFFSLFEINEYASSHPKTEMQEKRFPPPDYSDKNVVKSSGMIERENEQSLRKTIIHYYEIHLANYLLYKKCINKSQHEAIIAYLEKH